MLLIPVKVFRGELLLNKTTLNLNFKWNNHVLINRAQNRPAQNSVTRSLSVVGQKIKKGCANDKNIEYFNQDIMGML